MEIFLSLCEFHTPGRNQYRLERSLSSFSATKASVLLCRQLASARKPNTRIYYYHKKPPKHLRYPRRTKLSPDLKLGFDIALGNDEEKKKKSNSTSSFVDADDELIQNKVPVYSPVVGEFDDSGYDSEGGEEERDGNIAWEADEIEAISSLFRGRIPQKPGNMNTSRVRPLPLPLPYKLRPLGLPTPKKRERRAYSHRQAHKSPTFLIGLAREIRSLPTGENASTVLEKWAPFLRKGSLSLTVRELGHMGLPERALQTFSWAQKQPLLFPDDRLLASTVEVLAKAHELRVPFDLDKFISLASRSVYEAMVRGFIKGGNLKLAWKLLSAATDGKRMLDASIYVKLILDLGKNPDKSELVLALLEELSGREDLKLTQQDCTAIMKVCIRLGKYETVEGLYDWFRNSGQVPTVVMYTTLIHSRFSEKRYREALAIVWEMEASNCLVDLPAYRVVIKLFVALNDLPRAVRYFSKLKEAGFSPTFDIYQNLIKIYMVSGRLAKCREICKEAEMAGFKMHLQNDC